MHLQCWLLGEVERVQSGPKCERYTNLQRGQCLDRRFRFTLQVQQSFMDCPFKAVGPAAPPGLPACDCCCPAVFNRGVCSDVAAASEAVLPAVAALLPAVLGVVRFDAASRWRAYGPCSAGQHKAPANHNACMPRWALPLCPHQQQGNGVNNISPSARWGLHQGSLTYSSASTSQTLKSGHRAKQRLHMHV
jgi:hypothetical protein